MRFKVLVLSVAMIIVTPLAAAGNSDFYGAIDFGTATIGGFCNGAAAAGVSCSENDTSVRFAVGNQFNDNFGVEASYGPAVEATGSAPGIAVSFKNTEWQLSAIGTLPVNNKFSLFAKAGIAFWEVQGSVNGIESYNKSGNDFLWGVGAKYDVNSTIAIRALYETNKIDDIDPNDFKTLSMGLVFKF